MTAVDLKRVRKVENDHTFILEMKLEDLDQGPYFAMSLLEYDRIVDVNGHIVDRMAGYGRTKEVDFDTLTRDESTIARLFPEYLKYLKWHCWHIDRGEWYYMQNAMYHAGFGRYSDLNLTHLASTIAYGAIPNEHDIANESIKDQQEFASWLATRYPDVMKAFYRDMRILWDTYMFRDMVPTRHNEFEMYGL
jgi:hypothetical protein